MNGLNLMEYIVVNAQSLEEYRKKALEIIYSERDEIKDIAEDVLKEKVYKIDPIGSVNDPNKFSEESDIDVGIYLNCDADEVNENKSEQLQNVMIKNPLGDLGVINTVVFE